MKKKVTALILTISMICSLIPSIKAIEQVAETQETAGIEDALDILKHLAGVEILSVTRRMELDFRSDNTFNIDSVLIILKGLAGLTERPVLHKTKWGDNLVEYLSQYGTPSNAIVNTKYIKTYSNGFAFLLLNHSPVALEAHIIEIEGVKFGRGSPTLYFYVSDTSEFLQIAEHNKIELLNVLSIDELGDLSERQRNSNLC
jgi:hypothetical protein